MHGWIKQQTVDLFVDKLSQLIQESEKKYLVYYFKEANLLNEEQIEEIAKLQRLKHKIIRFHCLAVEQGYLKRTTVDFFITHLFNIYNPRAISVIKPYKALKKYSKGEKTFTKLTLAWHL